MKSRTIAYALPVLAVLGVSTADAAWGNYSDEDRQQFRQELRQNFQGNKNFGNFEKREFSGKKRGKFARRGMHQNMEGVEHNVTKLSNGLRVVMTSDDSEVVTKLQEQATNRSERAQNRENVNVTVTNLSNGVQIDTTTTDAEILEKMHEKADRKALKNSIEKVVENISNGVKITITSDNSDAVTKIQEKEPKQPRNEAVSISKVNISNGSVITITTENEDLVEKIQERAERKKDGKGKRGYRGGWGRN